MINRVNIDKFKETIEKAKRDPSFSKKRLEIEGTWRLDEQTGPQFESKLKTENAGEIILQTDETIILGGGGTAFNPVQLCIAGLIACYAATFAKWAGMAGIELKRFKIKASANLDLSAAFGITENKALDNLRMELVIDSDTPMEKLLEINEIAKKRCPGYYCLSHEIIPQIDIKKAEMTKANKSKKNKVITIILNKSPYGDEYAYNALRFATALIANGEKVNIFLLGDGVYIANRNQATPKNATNIQEMLQNFLIGRAEIKVCGLCAKSRGIEKELLEGCPISTMMDLARWVSESDQTINF